MIIGDYLGIAIEDNIPIPERPQLRDKYPWHLLEIGQSFLARVEDGKTIKQLSNSLTSCRSLAQRKSGKKFTMHRSHKGIRVWRVA